MCSVWLPPGRVAARRCGRRQPPTAPHPSPGTSNASHKGLLHPPNRPNPTEGRSPFQTASAPGPRSFPCRPHPLRPGPELLPVVLPMPEAAEGRRPGCGEYARVLPGAGHSSRPLGLIMEADYSPRELTMWTAALTTAGQFGCPYWNTPTSSARQPRITRHQERCLRDDQSRTTGQGRTRIPSRGCAPCRHPVRMTALPLRAAQACRRSVRHGPRGHHDLSR